MELSRHWSMPNKNTFLIKPIAECIRRHIDHGKWIDPFAGKSVFNQECFATNDLSDEMKTTHNLESLEFLSLFEDKSLDGVLFDPPYSPRQIKECYKSVGKEVFKSDTQISFYTNRKKEISRVIKKGGIAICCGWNSNGIGKKLGFELIELLLVAHGSAHNDTIITIEKKI